MSFGRKHAFFILAFTTGLREGLESIVFLVGVISDVKDLSSLPIPIISALILSRLVGCCFFQGTKKVRVDWFMRGSAILLMFIAAGFFSASMHQLQELDVFGIWSPRVDRPWQNQQVWDARGCCNDKTNRYFVLMRALFGWQDQATPIEIFAWFIYWIVGIALVYCMIRRAKIQLAKKMEEWRRQDEEDASKANLMELRRMALEHVFICRLPGLTTADTVAVLYGRAMQRFSYLGQLAIRQLQRKRFHPKRYCYSVAWMIKFWS
eukprot:Skav215536  [mRNA]  locus=scaffold4176:42178:44567:- [translate_table: standard]